MVKIEYIDVNKLSKVVMFFNYFILIMIIVFLLEDEIIH